MADHGPDLDRGSGGTIDGGQRPRKPGARASGPRKATARYLQNAALYYLQRYATSAANLRRVLMGKVDRSARAHGTNAEEGARLVDGLIERYREVGLLDDAVYAAGRTRSLNRRGDSPRLIRAKLARKGVTGEDVDRALAELAEDVGDPTRVAAVALAKRRRLGPFRPPYARAAFRNKDMAAMARAGFPYQVAREVIDAESADDLLTLSG
ncbi:regulatory protein RecX [Inquilinus sp. CAU 1745]|uniref:regulatory protein RecX n=1 Tax=Inquilinus sp. CAU 1745 TaxID=3140369 RepID=UPI00325BC352